MNRLKELRIQHGYKSQKELADILFVNQTAVSQWERGITTPSSQMLQRLSELYQVSIDYLLGKEEKEKPTPENWGGLSETAKQIMECVSQMSEREQETFLAWLQASRGRD